MSSNPQNARSASTATFVTALVFNAAVFAAEIVAFTIIRPYFKSIYEPRTFIPVPSKRVQPLSSRMLTWPLAVFKSDYRAIQRANGADAYLFVRYLRMMTRVFLPIWLISWVVLLPITSVGTSVSPNSGLDDFIFGNVESTLQTRYWAHLVLTYFFTLWIWWNIKHEMRHFLITRQKHLIDPVHSASVQANTVLLTGIPTRYLSQNALKRLFSHLPGGVKTVWLNRDLKELPDLYDRRMAACAKLESAETTLLRTATKRRNKKLKAEAKAAKKASKATDPGPVADDSIDPDAERDITLAEKLVPKNKRPSHRLPLGFMPFSLPLVGKKVDSIDWAREEIVNTTKLLEKGRDVIASENPDVAMTKASFLGKFVEPAEGIPVVGGLVKRAHTHANPWDEGDGKAAVEHTSPEGSARSSAEARPPSIASTHDEDDKKKKQEYPPLNSAFITFNKQIAAHMAAEVLVHHEPYRMAQRHLEVAPEDVIWGNLGLNPYEAKVRMILSYSATAGLIILWAFPVAFIGIVSNIYSLCATYHWLSWICSLPKPIVGIISGILPPVLLAVLMMLLPIILRLLARFEGIPRRSGLELSLMNRFFLFQVIHSFLIVTISSGIIAALPGLVENPTSVPTLLAHNLPQASTFFLTYIILQGLSGTAGGFLQVVQLILYYAKLFVLGSTPRSIFNIKYGTRSVAWGTLFPSINLLVVITLGYSIISPIINGLAWATFFLFYQLYKYLFLWQFTQPASSDTGGLFFPKAIQHLFVGMYVQQLCLCALFFLARDENNHASSIPEGALMVVLIVFTAFFHILINNSYDPLIHALPLTLAHRTHGTLPAKEDEDERKPLIEGSEKGKEGAAPVGKARDFAREDGQTDGTEHVYPQDQGSPHTAKPKLEDEHANQSTNHVPYKDLPPDSEPSLGDPITTGRGAPHATQTKTTEDYGFAHPATSRPQRPVWFPQDQLGLGKEEEAALRELDIDASMEGAEMNEKGKVEISGAPPGDEHSN